jgi:hypothetical protein
MIAECLKAMGAGGVAVPAGWTAIDPPRDVKWFGNHAPTELAKLLEFCGCVFVPTRRASSPSRRRRGPGAGDAAGPGPVGADPPLHRPPRPDDRLHQLPDPRHVSIELVGPRTPSDDPLDDFGFVIRDTNGTWQSIYLTQLLPPHGPEYHVQHGFEDLKDAARAGEEGALPLRPDPAERLPAGRRAGADEDVPEGRHGRHDRGLRRSSR